MNGSLLAMPDFITRIADLLQVDPQVVLRRLLTIVASSGRWRGWVTGSCGCWRGASSAPWTTATTTP